EDLGSFRLEQDLPPGHAGVGPGVDLHAVDDIGDLVAVADDLDGIPLARGLFGVALLLLEASFDLAIDRDGCSVDHPEVAAVMLLDLAFDRLRPDLGGSGAVQEDARVADRVLARRPALAAPLELHDEAVVVVLLVGGQAAELLARDVDDAVLD